MFEPPITHICSIETKSSKSFLPPLPPNASTFLRWKRFLKKTILITEVNPQSNRFFKSSSDITNERKKQVENGTWIIHPFSTFRIYYEMWMAFVFFFCLVYFPADASYKYRLPYFTDYIEITLCFFCWVDIYLNFKTGYKRNDKIEMRIKYIIGHYIFKSYFVFDVVSSIPETTWWSSPEIVYLLDLLAMLKIVRLATFKKYMSRSLTFYKVTTVTQYAINVLVIVVLILHYASCFLFISTVIFEYINDENYEVHRANTTSTFDLFLHNYLLYTYSASSLLLSIDFPFSYNSPWITYMFCITYYFLGKILITFLSVILINILYTRNCLETKYHAIMSQVAEYMKANQFPITLQNKLRDYYHYKYRNKYFNESRIDRFISDKLKKEIKYNDCRKLVQSVHIFENLPQSILEEILSYLKWEIYLPKDYIITAGSEGDAMYFLSSGTVAVLSPSGKEICHLSDGDYFGEIALLFTKQKRTANIVALEVCEVFKLDRRSLKKCHETHKDIFKDVMHKAKKRYAATKETERSFLRSVSKTE